MSDLKTVKISGKLFWARWMADINKQFNDDNDRYECTIGEISEADCEKLKGLGIKIKQKSFAPNVIVGKSKFVFTPKTQDGKPVAIEDIGNGTEVSVIVGSYAHKMSKMHGNAPAIDGKNMIVTKLVTYVPENQEDELDGVL
jgi:hypothetical protein